MPTSKNKQSPAELLYGRSLSLPFIPRSILINNTRNRFIYSAKSNQPYTNLGLNEILINMYQNNLLFIPDFSNEMIQLLQNYNNNISVRIIVPKNLLYRSN
ncbi:hypothetical protein A3Q56_08497 [Intoshia linei]|uniref:Uncharacterized protein n=1 Tax=Intoshia linei TaxID=1819745 RepID=A0A177AQX4_9BILA|nr:hypothetical protein A3Q56_08497 [Intoshia linei]